MQILAQHDDNEHGEKVEDEVKVIFRQQHARIPPQTLGVCVNHIKRDDRTGVHNEVENRIMRGFAVVTRCRWFRFDFTM